MTNAEIAYRPDIRTAEGSHEKHLSSPDTDTSHFDERRHGIIVTFSPE
jgi:hypothetical protein